MAPSRSAAFATLLCAGLAAAQLAAPQAAEASQGPRYRFVFTRVDGHPDSDAVALGEVELLGVDGQQLTIFSITNPGGAHKVAENAERAVDGTAATKWIDTNYLEPAPGLLAANTSILQLTLAHPTDVAVGYRLYTANDAPPRDPVAWRFERRSPTDDAWHVLHQVDGLRPPFMRSTSFLPGDDAFWITAPPPAPPRPEYRLLVTATRDIPHTTDSVALGEVILWTHHPLHAPIYHVDNPGGVNPRGQGARSATDGLVRTKWLDIGFASTRRSELRFTLAADVAVHSYELVTANDAIKRDPISWSFDVRRPDGSWQVLSTVHAFRAPTSRNA
eukprot:3759559-Prymnesium_polylepis.1